MATKKTKIDDFEDDLNDISPELLQKIKDEVKAELQKDNEKLKDEIKKKRSVEKRMRTQYVNKMSDSDLPWFMMVATTPEEDFEVDEAGLAYEMEWNTPFQQFLVSKKIMGSNDLDRVEHWLIEMLHSIIESKEAEKMENNDSEFE